jgi:hypothetical protein
MFRLFLDDVISAYIVCAFESAWNFTSTSASVWCVPFSDPKDLEAMEFMEDLHRWHVHAHGHHINYLLGCSLARHLVSNFRASLASASSRSPKSKLTAEFHFTHCGAMQKLLTRLQLFKDDFLTAADFPNKSSHRLWRGSRTTPFGANVAIVLNDCGASAGFKVQTFVNELPVKLPFCGDELCDFETFAVQFGEGYCHLESLCNANSPVAYLAAGFVSLCLLVVVARFVSKRNRLDDEHSKSD